MRPLAFALPFGAALALAAPAAAATCPAGATCTSGYVPMSDGVELRYRVARPAEPERAPVALVYDGYCEGTDPLTCNDGRLGPALLKAGYAVLGANIRGSGCSEGDFDLFSVRDIRDGAQLVEWAAAQPWSTGKVGMFGVSLPGMMAHAVAALRPRGLAAIAPFQAITNPYRQVAWPGGLFNSGFARFWSDAVQPQTSANAAREGAAEGDERCAAALERLAAAKNLARFGAEHPFEDDVVLDLLQSRGQFRRVDVPVLACFTWQDDELSSSWADSLAAHRRLWVIAANGYHGQCSHETRTTTAFFDRFVRGERNGFEHRTPRVRLDHEAMLQFTGKGDMFPAARARWSTHHDHWPVPTRKTTLRLQPGGVLDQRAPRGRGSDAYSYPRPSAGQGAGIIENLSGRQGAEWEHPAPTEGVLAYTTPRLTRDAEFIGPASADLWLTSTAADTDVQITVTEVRPDAREVYVSRGWLRASKRRLDTKRSTPVAPFHTYAASDARPLTPRRPALLRVALTPFDHVFRKGSRLRMIVDAPTSTTGGWSFDYLRTESVNRVSHSRRHRSRLVMGLLPGGRAPVAAGPCKGISNQPCRSNPFPLPTGRLTVRPDAR